MLEKMNDFFNDRVSGYEKHQLTAIDFAREFYPFTAKCLPPRAGATLLDLGCGTGLELGYYFEINPSAKVVGIDIAEDMLKIAKAKFSDRTFTVILGSYFDVTFDADCYDAVVSVESLHHFTKDEKVPLYEKVFVALKSAGYFILTDYFARSDEEESFYRQELARLKAEQGINDNEFYHYDIPLTAEHEIQALHRAGFSVVDIIAKWGSTCAIKAEK